MSVISDLLTGGVGSIVTAVTDAADRFITTEKERKAAEIELENIGLKHEEALLADRDSARKMQIAALGQDDLFSKRFIYVFAAGWSIFAMVFFCLVTFAEIPETNVRIADTILGFLIGTAIASIFNFFLGTTHRSQKKDDAIQALAGK